MSLNASALAALLAEPGLEPPAGTVAQFDNPPNRNGLAMFVISICAVLTTIFVVIRLVAKIRLDRNVRTQEVLMVVGFAIYWGTSYASYQLIQSPGYYVHTWDLTKGELVYPLYLVLVYGCCYSAVLPLLKTAILLDWCCLFVPNNRFRNRFWWSAIMLAAVQCIWGAVCILLLNMQCRPHRAIWEFYLPSKCYSLPSVMLASGSIQVATDFLMLLLPQRIIWNLNLNWQKRAAVSVVFGVGALGFVAACMRLQTTLVFSRSDDNMYLLGALMFWADAEMTCAFFIFSVTCIPKLLSRSPISRRLKAMFGVGSSAKQSNVQTPVNGNTYALSKAVGGRGNHSRAVTAVVIPGAAKSPYYTLDAGDDHASAESQENLRSPFYAAHGYTNGDVKAAGGIVVSRTMEVTVSSETHSNSSQESPEWKIGE